MQANHIGAGNRFISLNAVVLAVACAALMIPAAGQERRHRAAPGTVIIPPSNQAALEDIGAKAHTNLRLVTPPSASPSELPPYLGYGYETPASLACIYRLAAPIRGCNPNSTINNPNGGSQSIAIVDAFDDPGAAADLEFGSPWDFMGKARFMTT